MKCAACHGLEGPHTCEASGTAVAAGAHEAGAVSTVTAIPLFDVHLGFVVEALEEADVRDKIADLVADLLDDDDVSEAAFSVIQR